MHVVRVRAYAAASDATIGFSVVMMIACIDEKFHTCDSVRFVLFSFRFLVVHAGGGKHVEG